ncbi:hypothetical protein NLG42_10500 [Flavobacterium plurextorum]|uniref:hypothetical protein n=1 Tax=Flavobacterium TaxID=237 RepID=UPI00214D36B1|nr:MULTISPECIES: hypothetical protein [Flavobacterium]UUW11217.1 hypothetical protein NLG42_10500 [Flavobacterium plurextorum]
MEKYLHEKLNIFQILFASQKYIEAKDLCYDVVENSKTALADRSINSEEENNLYYIAAMLFKGFSEYIDLQNLIKESLWFKNKEKVEKIWYLLCDCADHLNFCICVIEVKILTVIVNKVKNIKKKFKEKFGAGMYLSPVITISKETCSICSKDVRSCIHRQGVLYNGLICRYVAAEISNFSGVDIVKVPKDPRCRIWPWNGDGKKFNAMVLSLNCVDDFLYKENDDNTSN